MYTVTSTSITAASGSPFTIPATPNALAVVPTTTACSAPSSAGVHICNPASGTAVSSPVLVQAAATVTGTISNMQLWVDGRRRTLCPVAKLSTRRSASPLARTALPSSPPTPRDRSGSQPSPQQCSNIPKVYPTQNIPERNPPLRVCPIEALTAAIQLPSPRFERTTSRGEQ